MSASSAVEAAGPIGAAMALGYTSAPWYVMIAPPGAYLVVYICRLAATYDLSRRTLGLVKKEITGGEAERIIGALGRQTPPPEVPGAREDKTLRPRWRTAPRRAGKIDQRADDGAA